MTIMPAFNSRPRVRALCYGLASGLMYLISGNLLSHSSGTLLWLIFCIQAACLLIALSFVVDLLLAGSRIQTLSRSVSTNVLLVIGSLSASAVVAESLTPAVTRLLSAQSISEAVPEHLAMRDTKIPGASTAYYWHGILHVQDENHFRHIGAWPEKDPRKLRIAIFGDSLTYGQGVLEEQTYPRVLETALSQDVDVEVINLGVQGYQSVDILATMKRMLPIVKPDLVLYGVCLNDFLPHSAKQYSDRTFSLPIPEEIKDAFLQRTKLGPALDRGFRQLLLSLHIKKDFYDDILDDFSHYQAAFATHTKKMNALVVGEGLPPLVALVLDQFPKLGSSGERIAKIAEEALKSAGADVIPVQSFYERYNGRNFAVSPWEGHPNAEAHQIFATMFAEKLRDLPILLKYKKAS